MSWSPTVPKQIERAHIVEYYLCIRRGYAHLIWHQSMAFWPLWLPMVVRTLNHGLIPPTNTSPSALSCWPGHPAPGVAPQKHARCCWSHSATEQPSQKIRVQELYGGRSSPRNARWFWALTPLITHADVAALREDTKKEHTQEINCSVSFFLPKIDPHTPQGVSPARQITSIPPALCSLLCVEVFKIAYEKIISIESSTQMIPNFVKFIQWIKCIICYDDELLSIQEFLEGV